MQEHIPVSILNRKLNEDFIKKSVSGCFFFAVMAIILIYIDWIPNEETMLFKIDYLLYLLLLTNIVRYAILKLALKDHEKALWVRASKILSLVNPLLWGTIFAQVLWVDRFQTEASLVVIFLTAGYAVGATMSLASAKPVIFIYQVLLQSPIVIAGFMLALQQRSGQAVMIAFSIFMFFAYNSFQSIVIRRQLIATIRSLYFLEKSKIELEESEKKLKEESSKVIHSSRLASLGEMAGGVAHEINNPLAVLTLNNEGLASLLEPHKTLLGESVFKKLEKISRSTTRIKTIVSGLKSFSQQGDELPFEETSLQKIFNESLEFCNEKIKSLSIDFKVQGDLNVLISVRPVHISQIILNLLNNAVDAVKETAHPKILLNVSKFDDAVYIEVTDSGTGVPDHIKLKLFQPFMTSKEVGKGTGLGLSISRGLARDHGGDLILVENEKQTTFRLILPFIKEQKAFA